MAYFSLFTFYFSLVLLQCKRAPSGGVGQGAVGHVGHHYFLNGRSPRIVIIGIQSQADGEALAGRQAEIRPGDGRFQHVACGRLLRRHGDDVATWRIQNRPAGRALVAERGRATARKIPRRQRNLVIVWAKAIAKIRVAVGVELHVYAVAPENLVAAGGLHMRIIGNGDGDYRLPLSQLSCQTAVQSAVPFQLATL